ncbi:2',3'-cyclic-nucleotide 3'-phosphodiesterase [Cercophora newfieldiana]|uniref:2',3'-cyclic-nucleotide 3'-phosphodiesterase n=1 Tax=Cercophora newfieldiana TaxID=92897 RepID=A0AA39Y330_9PEZI|nr:2',3'-cyclic-nucleotide 3'-phosphodiesterase [Cercophora newfieldiana]
MPGSSLWLLPPPSSPLHSALKTLITKTLPSLLPSESTFSILAPDFFPPHMTLTSEISPSLYGDYPQAWLDSIPFPSAEDVCVRFGDVASQEVFYRRCFIRVGLEGVRAAVGIARARGVTGEEEVGERTKEWVEWWVREYGPHVSLMYGGVSMDEVKMERVAKAVEEAGIKLCADGSDDTKDASGWDGGVVWLVPTDQPISEWQPIAVREL